VDDTYETDQDVQLVVPAPGVLGNDDDVDGDNLTATLKTNVTNGVLVLKGDGSFTYTPKAGFCGIDSFVYTLVSYPSINSDGWTADATATITVYCDPIISSDDLDGPFYVGNEQEFHVTLTNLEYGTILQTFWLASAWKILPWLISRASNTWKPQLTLMCGWICRLHRMALTSLATLVLRKASR